MARGVSEALPASLREEMPELLAAFWVPYMCPDSMLTSSPLDLPTTAKGIPVGETAVSM